MTNMIAKWALGLALTLALAGCPAVDKAADTQPVEATSAEIKTVGMPPSEIQPAETKPVSEAQSYVGWYMERAGQGVFQSCGTSQQVPVSGSAELVSKAREFGLEQDTPIYVRLVGTLSANGEMLEVSRVEQFGSPTPVRDCGMTGVVIPDPGN